MFSKVTLILVLLGLIVFFSGCTTAPETDNNDTAGANDFSADNPADQPADLGEDTSAPQDTTNSDNSSFEGTGLPPGLLPTDPQLNPPNE